MIPIYEKKTRIKILVAVLALLIGAATIIYTNWLVQRVSEREQQQIQLYARAQEYIIKGVLPMIYKYTKGLHTLFFIDEKNGN